MPSRPPRRARTQRAVTVIHFDKRPPPPVEPAPARRRATTKQMPAVGASPFDDEDTAVTAPGEESTDAKEVAAPSLHTDSLVEVPRGGGEGQYSPGIVARLLKGQRPGHPFPPLADDEITELACFGRFLFESERLEDAQLVLEGLVASGVLDAFPYSMLGTVYLAQRDLNRALALFEAALALAPGDLAAHVYRAEIRLHQGRSDLAMADIRYALEHGDRDDPFTARAGELRLLARRTRG